MATISVPASTNGTDSQPNTVTRARGVTPSSSSTRSTGVREPGANVGAACGSAERSSMVSRPSLTRGFDASTTQTNRSRKSSACLPGKSYPTGPISRSSVDSGWLDAGRLAGSGCTFSLIRGAVFLTRRSSGSARIVTA